MGGLESGGRRVLVSPRDPAEGSGEGGPSRSRPAHKSDEIDALAFAAQRFLAAASWQECILDVLGRLGEAADLSRVYVFENRTDDDGRLLASRRYEWAAPGIPAQITDAAEEGQPWEGVGWRRWAEGFGRGEALYGKIQEFPEEERAGLKEQNINSIALAPIFVGREWWGFIGFDECSTERDWSPWEISTLKGAAATLGAAIGRRQAAEHLQAAESRYRGLVEQIPAMTYLDEVGGPDEGIYVSPQIRDLLGFEPEDWYAEPEFWRNHVHPDDEPGVWADWRRTVEKGGVFAREYRMVALDGSVVWVSERTTILPDESGRPRWIQGVLTDISNLKEAEERFRIVFEACPIGIVIVGNDFRFLDANPAFCNLLRYTREDVRTLTFVDVTHPEDIAIDAELARQAFAGEIASYSLEKRYLTSDGETVWVNLTASRMPDESGTSTHGIGVVEDITARKRQEAENLRGAAEANRRLGELTPREREVLDVLADQGLTAREVSQTLHISRRTTESHLASVYRKLNVTTRDSALGEYERLRAAAAWSTRAPDRVIRNRNP
jgi:PAS domain S-box-containing protein